MANFITLLIWSKLKTWRKAAERGRKKTKHHMIQYLQPLFCSPCSERIVKGTKRKRKPEMESTIFRYQCTSSQFLGINLPHHSEYMSNECQLLKADHWFVTLGTDTVLLPAEAKHVTRLSDDVKERRSKFSGGLGIPRALIKEIICCCHLFCWVFARIESTKPGSFGRIPSWKPPQSSACRP